MNNNTIEVLVAYTRPKIWKAVQRRGIANQAANKKDAKYIAFFLISDKKDENGKKIPSVITHRAEVIETKIVPCGRSYFEKEMPEALELAIEKGWDKEESCKEYKLGNIIELNHFIYHRPGKRARFRVCMYTKLSELEKANFIDEIKTESHLKKESK